MMVREVILRQDNGPERRRRYVAENGCRTRREASVLCGLGDSHTLSGLWCQTLRMVRRALWNPQEAAFGAPMVWESVSPGFPPTEIQQGYSRLDAGGKLAAMVSLLLDKLRGGAGDLSRVRIPEPGCLGLKPVLSPSRGGDLERVTSAWFFTSVQEG